VIGHGGRNDEVEQGRVSIRPLCHHEAGDHVSARTVSEAVAAVVMRRTELIFGLMGNGNAHFVSSLTASGAGFVSVRHEVATVIAAQSAYLASGKVAVATTSYGAGFTNMITSLAEARISRVPVVVVVGDAPSTGRRVQDVDQIAMAEAAGVRTWTVRADDASAQTMRAFDVAERDRVPVIVAIPYDVVDVDEEHGVELAEVPPEAVLRLSEIAAHPTVNAVQVERIASLLQRAQRPLVIGGRGAVLSGAAESLRAVGDQVGAVFATSLMAANLFGSRWDVGVAGGFSSPRGADLIKEADVALVVGASLNLYQMRYGHLFAEGCTVVQVDVLEKATNDRVDLFVRADGAEFGTALRQYLALPGTRTRSEWRECLTDSATSNNSGDREMFPEFGPDGKLDPRAVMTALNTLLPSQRTVVQDTGHFMGWAPRHLGSPDPQGMLSPGLGLQSIGLGFGAAVGAAHSRKDRLPVLVIGDGGAAMALGELDTLVRTVRSGVVVILNDAAYGMEVHQYGPRGLDTAAMLFVETDFAAIAESMSATGVTVRSLNDLEAVNTWVHAGARGLLVLNVWISRKIVADWLLESNTYYAAQRNSVRAAGKPSFA